MRRLALIIAVGLSAPFSVPAALGHDPVARTSTPQVTAQTPTPCECRTQQRKFVVGEETCLNGKVAICSMDQNVTSWRTTPQACPSS